MAIKTLQRVMTSGGDTAALKAALYVLESVERQERGLRSLLSFIKQVDR